MAFWSDAIVRVRQCRLSRATNISQGRCAAGFAWVTFGLTIGKPAALLLYRGWLHAWAWRRCRVFDGLTSVSSDLLVAGFKMALFIAQLAFPSGPLLETAKVAVLFGSGLVGRRAPGP